jgi:hypothetical protein
MSIVAQDAAHFFRDAGGNYDFIGDKLVKAMC